MVDVKRVTASIKKPIYYANQTSSVTNEVVNFNPTNNPITPETNNTVYTIDPFAVFMQEDSTLKVKIPFTRFYRLKYAITITNTGYTVAPAPYVDQFSISKPIMTCTESVSLKRLSNGVTTQIQTNVYTQDGSGLLVHDPVMSGAVISDYNVIQTLTPAIIEGIVELYAGDVLTFEHTRTMFKKSKVTSIASIDAPVNTKPGGLDLEQYYGPVDLTDPYNHYTYAKLNMGDFPFVTVDSTAYKTNASFFFEMSEITDL